MLLEDMDSYQTSREKKVESVTDQLIIQVENKKDDYFQRYPIIFYTHRTDISVMSPRA